VKTWLYAILTRQAAKGWHKSRHIRAATPIGGPEEIDPAAVEKSESAESAGQRMDLMAAIASLPAVYREALVLREVDGLKYEEIARTLKLPRGTVESRIFRARAELRNKLKSYGITSSASRGHEQL
jgi:RNA polymerase sigma-70 factor (ECF subfamily)